jgi:hypothetical protein
MASPVCLLTELRGEPGRPGNRIELASAPGSQAPEPSQSPSAWRLPSPSSVLGSSRQPTPSSNTNRTEPSAQVPQVFEALHDLSSLILRVVSVGTILVTRLRIRVLRGEGGQVPVFEGLLEYPSVHV